MIVAALCAPVAGADDPSGRVSDVRVQGNTRTSRAAVMAHLRTQVGRIYDPKIVARDRQRLLRTGRFESVVIYGRTTPAGVVVTCVLVERDLVASVTFVHNRAFSAKELLKEVTVTPGGPLDVFAVEAGRRAIRLKYRNAGYYFAEVSYDADALAKRQQVIYSIIEGPDVNIFSLRFEGMTYFNAYQRKWMELTTLRSSDSPWWWLLPAGELKDDDVEHDVNAIRKRYVDEGFLDAAVSRTLEFSADKSDVALTYVVRENARFYVNKVIFRGNAVFSDAELARRLVLEPGDIVKSEAIKIDVERLTTTYGQLGYVDVAVRHVKQYLPPAAELPAWAQQIDDAYPVALVNIVYTIREGGQSRLGRVDVRPAAAYEFSRSVTQRRIALREMTLFPGQLFSMSAAKESENRLLDTRVFGQATIKPIAPIDPIAREFGIRDAVVEAVEGKTANFIVGVGVSTNTGVAGTISFAQRNFDIRAWPDEWRDVIRGHAWKGAGQTFQISGEPGTTISRFNVNWFEPAINDRPYTLNLRAFLASGIRETYDENRAGFGVSVGHRFKNGWYAELASRTENVEIVNIENDAPAQIVNLEGYTFLQGLKASLTRNRADSRWKPSTGDVLTIRFEQILGDFTFENVSAEYRIYQTLHVDSLDRKHILSGKAAVGQIIGYAPTFERYYGGGVGGIRGFRYRGISPRSGMTDEPIGGDFLAYLGAEYTYPLAGEQLRGVVFLDSGAVDQDIEFGTWRVSTGFGIRWQVPALGPVPVSLDFGFPLVKHRQDDTRLVSFTLGWMY